MRLLGRVLLVGLVAAAAVAGWFAVERYLLGDEGALPPLGDGLPTAPLPPPTTGWRSVLATESAPTFDRSVWIDADALESKTVSSDTDAATGVTTAGFEIEVVGDSAYSTRDGGPWTAMEDGAGESTTEVLSARSRPSMLTDVIPPALVPFAVVTDERDVDGTRRYTLTIDGPAFRTQRPLDFERWVLGSTDDAELPRDATVDVRSDGYVVALRYATADGAATSFTWEELTAPIPLRSPLAARPAVGTATPASTVPG
jgi:hypothetical protein